MSVQGSVNQLLNLTAGAVGLFGRSASEEALVNAVQDRSLAKERYEKVTNNLIENAERLNNLPIENEVEALESEISNLNKQGKTYSNSDEVKGKRDLVNDIKDVQDTINHEELQIGTKQPITEDEELELRKKYGNKGMIGRRKLAKAYQKDRDTYEYNEAIMQSRSGTYGDILDRVERDIQVREEANKRAEKERQEKQKQMKQLKKTKTSLGELGELPEHLQNKILEGLKKEEVNKK